MNSYKKKMFGCWRGKAIGGTLGMYSEGCFGVQNLKFYDPIPKEAIPNDDLELQLLWLYALQQKPVVDRLHLADYWLIFNQYPCDEYAVATRNLKLGILPPWSGEVDNFFRNGLGAAIRSEIWACLAPDKPKLAAAYAFEDACIDHAGEGIYAEMFLAAAESAAFGCSDLRKIIAVGLEQIPASCQLHDAITQTISNFDRKMDFGKLRHDIIVRYNNGNFTDVLLNIPFLIAALLIGDGDFGKTICTAVNFGADTDCTAASAGAILGLIAPDSIPKKWLDPVGDKLVLSQFLPNLPHPENIGELVDILADLKDKISLRDGKIVDQVTNLHLLDEMVEYTYGTRWDINLAGCRWKKIKLTGLNGQMPLSPDGCDRPLVIRRKVKIANSGDYRVMCNTLSDVFVMLDGKKLFTERGADLAPSAHRAPQKIDCFLDAGTHEFILFFYPNDYEQTCHQWVFGIAELPSLLWALNDEKKRLSC